MQQLLARHVDRNWHGATAVQPGSQLPASRARDPAAHLDDQAAVLGDLDKAVGRDLPVLRITPPQQRFHARDPIVGQAELRLETQLQAVILDGVPQTRFQVQPVAQTAAHRRRIHRNRCGRAALGLVHRDVGVLQHGGDVVAVVRINSEPDARCGVELEPLMVNGLLEHGAAFFRDLNGQRPRHSVTQQNHELIAPKAPHGDVLEYALETVHRSRQFAGNGSQNGVPDAVAEGVVDALEAVEIQIDDRDRFVQSRGFREHSLRRLRAALPVRQSGEGIEVSETLDALRRSRIAQDVFEAARQECPVHRFGDEVRGSRLEREPDRLGIFVPGHHHDRDSGQAGLGTQPSANGKPVHSRHVHVQQHDGDLSRESGFESRAAVVETERLEAALGGRLHEQQPAEILVVGDDRERSFGRRFAHAVALSFNSSNSSMSDGCVARNVSNSRCTATASPAAHDCSS